MDKQFVSGLDPHCLKRSDEVGGRKLPAGVFKKVRAVRLIHVSFKITRPPTLDNSPFDRVILAEITPMKWREKLKLEARIFKNLLYRRIYASPRREKDIVNLFHKLYYDSRLFGRGFLNTFWLGRPTFKCPLDLWIYQEIIYEKKPDLIIECGTAKGGSALFLALVCDGLNRGQVITIDIEADENRPKHTRITYLRGSSTSEEIIKRVEALATGKKEVMVILDSDHAKNHVLDELRRYQRFVTKGNYLIVEDTNLNGHPVIPDFGPGPAEAVQEFMAENRDFVTDREREKFYLTFNPGGFLKKIR